MSIVVESSLLNNVEPTLQEVMESASNFYNALKTCDKNRIKEIMELESDSICNFYDFLKTIFDKNHIKEFIENLGEWICSGLWEDIIENNDIECEILEKYKSKFTWYCWEVISEYKHLSEEFITENGDSFNNRCWENIIMKYGKIFTEEFLRRNAHQFNPHCWEFIIANYDLSKEFIYDNLEMLYNEDCIQCVIDKQRAQKKYRQLN